MNQARSYDHDREAADRFFPQIRTHLRRLSYLIFDWQPAGEAEDRKQATDYVVNTALGTVAARVRFDYEFRDLTLRCWRASGAKTELAKINEGYARWYFYAWSRNGAIIDWMLVDLDRLRSSGLLDQQTRIFNPDRSTAFISISRGKLIAEGCLVAAEGADKGYCSCILPNGQICRVKLVDIASMADGRCAWCRNQDHMAAPTPTLMASPLIAFITSLIALFIQIKRPRFG